MRVLLGTMALLTTAGLAACQTGVPGAVGLSAAQQPRVQSASYFAGTGPQGLRAVASAGQLSGSWTLSDGFSRCLLTLSPAPAAGRGFVMDVLRHGLCTSDFEAIGGWQVAGDTLVLTDMRGRPLGQLLPDGPGGFAGELGTRFGSSSVRLERNS